MRRSGSVVGVFGLFGGTFDPVHIGHLRTAYELLEQLGLDELRFIPAAVPPHKPAPRASTNVRVRMLEAAIEGEPRFTIDRRELDRSGPCYTVETAASLRDEFPRHALCLLLGMDAFLGLTTWHEWERVLELVNVVVANRPGASLPARGSLGRLLKDRWAGNDAAWQPSGKIIVQDVTQLEVSSSRLRETIRAGLEPKYLVPEAVMRIILETGCYAERNEVADS